MLICQTEAAISARLLLLPAWRIRKSSILLSAFAGNTLTGCSGFPRRPSGASAQKRILPARENGGLPPSF